MYYVLSDDRSAKNPAKFYTVRIAFPDNKLGSVEWVSTTPLLLNPWVRVAGLDGGFRGQFALPAVLDVSAEQTGARQNRALEGLTLTPAGTSLWAAMEGPGCVSPRPRQCGPRGDNGLSDLVALDDENFLVIERGYGTHVVVRI